MKKTLSMLMILVLLLGLYACGRSWTHPYIPDPRDEDMQYEVDEAQCESQSEDSDAFEKCMMDKGWERYD